MGSSSILPSFALDNTDEWEANSSPVIIDAGDPFKVTMDPIITDSYSSDGDFVEIVSRVSDFYNNPIIGQTVNNKLYYTDSDNKTYTGIADNNDGSYSLIYPIRAVSSQILINNYSPTDINFINNRNILVS